MQSETESDPVITAAQNGPGTANVTTTVFNTFGEPIWTKDADGYLTYTAYDTGTGAVVETITDVNTCDTSDFSGLPSGWTTPAGGGLNLVTTYQVDDQGRTIEETDPNGNITYTVYDDADQEVRVYPGWNSSTDTTTGPIEVIRDDQARALHRNADDGGHARHDGRRPQRRARRSATSRRLERDFTNTAGQVIDGGPVLRPDGFHVQRRSDWVLGRRQLLRDDYGYNADGVQDHVVSPTGTITDDGLRRPGAAAEHVGGHQRLDGTLVAEQHDRMVEAPTSTTTAASATAT